jgi:hypothetical protein
MDGVVFNLKLRRRRSSAKRRLSSRCAPQSLPAADAGQRHRVAGVRGTPQRS